jgi:hypothetical protein
MNVRPRRLAAVTALAATIAVLAWPSVARAAGPPDVTGLTIAAAKAALRQWRDDATIVYSPPLEQLPPGVDQSTVVVLRSAELPIPSNSKSPRILLELGAAVPDLVGLSRAEAQAALVPLGLVMEADTTAPDNWVVQLTKPAVGQLVPFGTPVTVILVAPPVRPTTEPPVPRPTSVPTAAVVGAGGLLLLLLVAGSTLALRRSRTRAPVTTVPPHIDVRGHHGEVIAPEVRSVGPDLSLRVVGHRGDPTYTVEEVVG